MLDFRLQTKEEQLVPSADELYDVVIVGGGPAGLSAGLYAARNGLNAVLLEASIIGGQAAGTDRIENWPGCHEGSGVQVMGFLRRQAESFGLKVVMAAVSQMSLDGQIKLVHTTKGVLRTKTIVIATGAKPVPLGVPGEERLQAHGVSHCATCDAPFFKERTVAVIGGGESALKEADFISRFAERVYVVHRRDNFRAAKSTQLRVRSNPRVEFIYDTVVEEILGTVRVTGIRLRNLKTGERSSLAVDGVFIYIGLLPNVEFLNGKLKQSPAGYIATDVHMATSVHGVFAAGDVRDTPLRQVVTATADGAIAAESADKYIQEHFVGVHAWKASA